MPAAILLDGQRFGRLLVLHREGNIRGSVAWKCECDCGKIVVTWTSEWAHEKLRVLAKRSDS